MMLGRSFKWQGQEIPRPALKLCAHCGSPAEYYASWPMLGCDDDTQIAGIICTNSVECGIRTNHININWRLPKPYEIAFREVADRWNRRT